MINVCGENSFGVVLYSCIFQIWEAVVRLCKFVIDPHDQYYSERNPEWEVDLPVSLCEELQLSEEEMCSICLVEFEGEDAVNKLPKCAHLFHAECLDKWVDSCHFSCPLCRSSFLRLRSSPLHS